MKKIALLVFMLGIALSMYSISPYYMVSEHQGDLASSELKVKEALNSNGFNIIGSYNTGGYNNYRVLVYTSDDLVKLCSGIEDRGILAAALKIGIRDRDGEVQVTMINPEYLFYAYLRNAMEKEGVKSAAMKIDSQVKKAMRTVGDEMTPFGGDLSKKKLKEYKYMMGMPKFSDLVVLKEFESHTQALNTIKRNLAAEKGNTKKVYELSSENGSSAVFGVALNDSEKGEAHFLSIIGKKHHAAMPYEIIVEGNTASILHGRFRFASHWPELTMGTFTKIMSSPGDVEDFLKALTD